MAITYPLDVPTDTSVAQITLRAVDAVAFMQSPFTYDGDVVQYSGQTWSASIQIPTVRRDLAEPWVAFLLSLDGPSGTFLLGDPVGATPRGSVVPPSTWFLSTGTWNSSGVWLDSVSWVSTSIKADNAAASGVNLANDSVIYVDGFVPSETGVLLPGDYIQLGTASTATLHKVLKQVDSDSNGAAEIDIWPAIRRDLVDDEVVTVQDAKGVFRLSSGQQSWSINSSGIYNISFEAIEDVT